MEREILLGITGTQWEMLDDGGQGPKDAEAVEMLTSLIISLKMESIISCMKRRLKAAENLGKVRSKSQETEVQRL